MSHCNSFSQWKNEIQQYERKDFSEQKPRTTMGITLDFWPNFKKSNKSFLLRFDIYMIPYPVNLSIIYIKTIYFYRITGWEMWHITAIIVGRITNLLLFYSSYNLQEWWIEIEKEHPETKKKFSKKHKHISYSNNDGDFAIQSYNQVNVCLK